MRIAGALIAVLLLAGCAAVHNVGTRTTSDVRLYEAIPNQIAVIDSQSQATNHLLPLGVPSSDWRHLYSVAGTSLRDTDPLTGATTAAIPLGSAYRLPAATLSGLPGGLSPNSQWLAVESYDGSRSRFAIVSTQAGRVASDIDLPGHFHVDAISDDGLRLYLIQYLNGREYYVRLYDVASRSMDENIVVDKSNGEQSMTGQRLSGVASPNGGWLFSMYVREDSNPFIHALSLDGPFAFCIDLPGGGYTANRAEMRWSLAMNGRGTNLYAVNGATGVIADLNIASDSAPQIVRTARIPGGGSSGAGSISAVMSQDGRTLVASGPTGIIWVDTASLSVRMRALDGWNVTSIALGPDGRTIYAADASGRIAELSIGTGNLISTFDPHLGPPTALMRVASA